MCYLNSGRELPIQAGLECIGLSAKVGYAPELTVISKNNRKSYTIYFELYKYLGTLLRLTSWQYTVDPVYATCPSRLGEMSTSAPGTTGHFKTYI